MQRKKIHVFLFAYLLMLCGIAYGTDEIKSAHDEKLSEAVPGPIASVLAPVGTGRSECIRVATEFYYTHKGDPALVPEMQMYVSTVLDSIAAIPPLSMPARDFETEDRLGELYLCLRNLLFNDYRTSKHRTLQIPLTDAQRESIKNILFSGKDCGLKSYFPNDSSYKNLLSMHAFAGFLATNDPKLQQDLFDEIRSFGDKRLLNNSVQIKDMFERDKMGIVKKKTDYGIRKTTFTYGPTFGSPESKWTEDDVEKRKYSQTSLNKDEVKQAAKRAQHAVCALGFYYKEAGYGKAKLMPENLQMLIEGYSKLTAEISLNDQVDDSSNYLRETLGDFGVNYDEYVHHVLDPIVRGPKSNDGTSFVSDLAPVRSSDQSPAQPISVESLDPSLRKILDQTNKWHSDLQNLDLAKLPRNKWPEANPGLFWELERVPSSEKQMKNIYALLKDPEFSSAFNHEEEKNWSRSSWFFDPLHFKPNYALNRFDPIITNPVFRNQSSVRVPVRPVIKISDSFKKQMQRDFPILVPGMENSPDLLWDRKNWSKDKFRANDLAEYILGRD